VSGSIDWKVGIFNRKLRHHIAAEWGDVNKYFSEVACPHYASLHCGGDSSKIYSLKEGVDDF